MKTNVQIGGLLLVALAYALLRYTVFKGVAVGHVPLYVGNKVLALVGLILVGLASKLGPLPLRRHLGMCGFALIVMHAAISCMILGPAYFGKFYLASGKMTWQAELSLLAGVSGLALLIWLVSSNPRPKPQPAQGNSLVPGVGRAVLGCTALHVLLMGYPGWGDVAAWPGYLPPITLLAFLVAVGLPWMRFRSSQRSSANIRQ